MSPTPPPPGKLADALIGDLGLAKRHLRRLLDGEFVGLNLERVYEEIERSVDDCIARIERDIRPQERVTIPANCAQCTTLTTDLAPVYLGRDHRGLPKWGLLCADCRKGHAA